MGGNASIQTNTLYGASTIAGSGQILAVAGTVVQLAAAAYPAGTETVKINVQGADVRMTTDGVDPAPGDDRGDIIPADSFIYLSYKQAVAAKFIQESSAATIYSEALKY